MKRIFVRRWYFPRSGSRRPCSPVPDGARPAGPGGGAPGGGGPGGAAVRPAARLRDVDLVDHGLDAGLFGRRGAGAAPGGVLGGVVRRRSRSPGNERDGLTSAGKGGRRTVRGTDHSLHHGRQQRQRRRLADGRRPAARNNVHCGDTLWVICGLLLHNPYQWPRIVGANRVNPHWIHPRPGSSDHGEVATIAAAADRRAVPSIAERRYPGGHDSPHQLIETELRLRGELSGAARGQDVPRRLHDEGLPPHHRHEPRGEGRPGGTAYRPIRRRRQRKLSIEIQSTRSTRRSGGTRTGTSHAPARSRRSTRSSTGARYAVGPATRKFEVDAARARFEKRSRRRQTPACTRTRLLPATTGSSSPTRARRTASRPGNRLFIIRQGRRPTPRSRRKNSTAEAASRSVNESPAPRS